jgi:type IV pilus assembly protein PilV
MRGPRGLVARARAGFSLISIMVAIVLLGTGAMAIAAANAASVRAQASAAAKTTSLASARAYLEEVRSRDPWTLDNETATSVNEDGRPDPDGAYTRSMTVTQVRTNLIKVDVAVSGRRMPVPIKVTTHIYRGGTIHQQ